MITMKSGYGNYRDHGVSFISEAHKEYGNAVLNDQLPQLEKTGRIAGLPKQPWFAPAKPASRRIGRRAIQRTARVLLAALLVTLPAARAQSPKSASKNGGRASANAALTLELSCRS